MALTYQQQAANLLLAHGWTPHEDYLVSTADVDYYSSKIQSAGLAAAQAELQAGDRSTGRAPVLADFANLPTAYQPSSAIDSTTDPPPPVTDDSGGITSLPLIGPLIGSIATATGLSPTIVALGLALGLALGGAYFFGVFDSGGERRR